MDTRKHKENAKGMSNQATITSTILEKRSSLENKITAAEVHFTAFIAEHNLPFSASDHFTKLCKAIFPDSKIAEGFACGRTKATSIFIVKFALAPALSHHNCVFLQILMCPGKIVKVQGNWELCPGINNFRLASLLTPMHTLALKFHREKKKKIFIMIISIKYNVNYVIVQTESGVTL